MTQEQATSSAAFAYRRIRSWILDGELPPGSRLVVRPLAEKLGLSPTPVKAALGALQSSGLIDVVVNAGYSVPHRDPVLFAQAMEMLCEYDVIAMRAALRQPDTDALLETLEALVARQGGRIAAHADPQEFDLDFHELLISHHDNPLLRQGADLARGRALVSSGQLLRHPSVLGQLHSEHEEILTAMRRADAAAAEEALREHGRGTIEGVLALFPRR
ncbi:GntR family transcriptional regulator [Brachybacterium hainanense]|uniref:GntR family transcriptional regulator n=1 Tax=Brachybacterium hainanense TaxID=1541174 RepID=A0ABV6RBF0_9MICO